MAPTTNGTSQHAAAQQATARASSLSDGDAKILWNRYEYTRFGDNMKNELIEDIINRYDQLVQTHKEYVEAHQAEREAAQVALARDSGLQGSVAHLQGLLNRGPFILVLVDGNGMIFHNNFLKQVEVGGVLAATNIEAAVLSWARAIIPDALPEDVEDLKVVVRIFADVPALAEQCAKAGIVDKPSRVDVFIRSFNQENPLIDFVDVGEGYQIAVKKVTESLKLHLHNYHCRHILFGCSHNDEYARILKPFLQEYQAPKRITLLEGAPFGPELTALPLPHHKIPGMFRETNIPSVMSHLSTASGTYADRRNRVGSTTSLNGASTVFTPRTNTPTNVTSPFGSVTSLDRYPVARVDSADIGSPGDGSGSWATVTGRNAHRPMKNEVTFPSSNVVHKIHRNRKGQRIDKPLDYNRDEVQRVKKLKACNQHYIGVGCCHYNAGKADKCPHRHDFDFSLSELKTLRVVARETPCKKGQECDDPKCIYGHQCPFPTAVEGSMRGSGQCLNGENCRFPASMHGVDTNIIKITKITGN